MKSQLTFPSSHAESLGHVNELSDAVLRHGHALLDDSRTSELSRWIDQGLDDLEARFRQFTTHQSLRKSLGR